MESSEPGVRALVAHTDLDNPKGLEQLLAPMAQPEELRQLLAPGKPLFCWAYDEESAIGRYIWSTGKEVLVFSLTNLRKDQAALVAEECAKIKCIEPSTFRAAVMSAIGVKI